MSVALQVVDPGRVLQRFFRRAARIVYIQTPSRSVRFKRSGGKQAAVRRLLPCNNVVKSHDESPEHDARDNAFADLANLT